MTWIDNNLPNEHKNQWAQKKKMYELDFIKI